MTKIKTRKAASKRFKSTGSGKLKRGQAYARHLLTGKSAKRKRNLRGSALISDADEKRIKKLLPNG